MMIARTPSRRRRRDRFCISRAYIVFDGAALRFVLQHDDSAAFAMFVDSWDL
jgi:hypothetical protein